MTTAYAEAMYVLERACERREFNGVYHFTCDDGRPVVADVEPGNVPAGYREHFNVVVTRYESPEAWEAQDEPETFLEIDTKDHLLVRAIIDGVVGRADAAIGG